MIVAFSLRLHDTGRALRTCGVHVAVGWTVSNCYACNARHFDDPSRSWILRFFTDIGSRDGVFDVLTRWYPTIETYQAERRAKAKV